MVAPGLLPCQTTNDTMFQKRPVQAVFAAVVAAVALPLFGAAAEAQQTPAPAATTATPNLSLLVKALSALRQSATARLEAQTQMTISVEGTPFTLREQIKLVARRPNRFRADIALVRPDGTPTAKYVVVSDGVKVWTHRPGTKQYSVTSIAEFDKSGDDFSIRGQFGSLFFNRDLLDGVSAMTSDNSALILQEMGKTGVKISDVGREVLEGAPFSVYSLLVEKAGVTTRFFLDAATAQVRRMETTLKEKEGVVIMRETVTRQDLGPTVPATTFRFVPPKGHVRVKAVTIEPL